MIAALTSALSFLYKSRIAAYEKAEVKLDTRVELLEKKLDKCEEEHTNAKVELAAIKTRLNILEKPTLTCGAKHDCTRNCGGNWQRRC